MISVSVISHAQGGLVGHLFDDLARHCASTVDVVLTLNVPERLAFDPADFAFPVRVIENPTPRGFGANHNAAFGVASHEFFCVLNPDIRLRADPFPALLNCLNDTTIGVVGPRVLSTDGHLEDSARSFPTPLSIFAKAMHGKRTIANAAQEGGYYPDWVAGMFMLFRREAFEQVGGFDEGYFLYYEDADICARLGRPGYRVGYCTDASVIHDARRTSRRNIRYALWHLSSMLRFFRRRAMRCI